MKNINSIILSGKESLPLIEGGKGIAVSSGESSGAWAKAGGVGTFSGVNADSYDDLGNLIPQVYKERTRSGRHRELVDFSVSGAIEQAKIARDIAGDKAPIHINILCFYLHYEKTAHLFTSPLFPQIILFWRFLKKQFIAPHFPQTNFKIY